MADMTIKVSTEVLVKASENLTNAVSKAHSTFQEIESIISRTVSYWEGSGHNAMNDAYKVRSDDYNMVFNAIKEHVAKLNNIAGVYSTTESQIVQATSMLSGDVIE